MSIKKIWSVGGWKNFNYGDCVLQKSSSDMLRNISPNTLDFTYIDTQRTWFSNTLIDKLNREADLLFLGGGGFIMHRPQDLSKSGWQLNIRTEDIKRINVPIVVYGIGCNKFPYDTHLFSNTMWENVQEIIDRSALFSVRNNGTLQIMRNAGLDVSRVEVVPDAGMFITPEAFNHSIFNHNGLKIGFNWATDRAVQRFGSSDAAAAKLELTLNVCRDICNKYDGRVYLFEHLIPNDLNRESKLALVRVAKKILGNNVSIVSELQEINPPHEYFAGFFADAYKKMDLVLGMRGHANIIPFGMNTPILGLGEHNKVKWFLEDVGRSNFLCPLNMSDEADEEDLASKLQLVLSDLSGNKASMHSKLLELSNKKEEFVGKVSNLGII